MAACAAQAAQAALLPSGWRAFMEQAASLASRLAGAGESGADADLAKAKASFQKK